jgi:hypothetical protein
MSAPPQDSQSWVMYLFSDRHLRLCALFSVIVVLMPPEGIPGLDLCVYKSLTGLPCPGCGITRSGSNLARGNFARAFNYHPFGPVLMPPIFLLGVMALLPRLWRDRVRSRVLTVANPLRRFYLALVVVFVVFGLLRSWCVFERWMTFPAEWL